MKHTVKRPRYIDAYRAQLAYYVRSWRFTIKKGSAIRVDVTERELCEMHRRTTR